MQSLNHQSARPSRTGTNTTASSALPSLADKARLTAARRSTPDSDALASSDDEHEMSKSSQSLTSNPTHLPAPGRRTSWLSEVKDTTQNRRLSFRSTTSGNSQPPTPSSDLNAWPGNNPLSRVVSNPTTSGAWSHIGNSANIWSSENRRDSLPGLNNLSLATGSPLSPHAPLIKQVASQRSAASASSDSNEQSFPFTIPLHPTPKAYRSQSYSVGQEEAKALASIANNQGMTASRQKQGLQSSLAHRPSRPSGLRDTEGLNMSALREEVDDDNNSDAGVALGSTNGMHDDEWQHLQRQAAQATYEQLYPRDRAPISYARTTSGGIMGAQHQAAGLTSFTESQQLENQGLSAGLGGNLTRRFSEYSAAPLGRDGNKRSQWSTALGFGDLDTIAGSRRHSMADTPTRRNSLAAAAADDSATFFPVSNDGAAIDYSNEVDNNEVQQSVMTPQQDYHLNAQNSGFAHLYFKGVSSAIRNQMESNPASQPPQQSLSGFRQGPPQGIFARPGKDTALYIVCFKCGRADVFYVAEGTGLEVKEGDMVIVEADRGYDLGTVLNAKVSWAQARELKDKSSDEHYRWLMMFSRHNHTPGSGNENNPSGMMAVSGKERSPQSSSIGPAGLGTGMFDAAEGSDLKPRMIKRLAQPHEVATLRDKEGNEAKAKRICQQKANELRFGMEILDAEFQMDWKKLSFYYYATGYVNFNPLVQELFKIYKTRIWMSAVNPDSMIAPTGPPRGMGPGAVEGRDTPMNPRSASFRQGSVNSYSQDYDPTGAIPPYQNPTTRSFQEFAAANTQPGANGYHGQPDNYLGFAQSTQQFQSPSTGPQTGLQYMGGPVSRDYGYNQARQDFDRNGRASGPTHNQNQYYSTQQAYGGANVGNDSLANNRPSSSAAYGYINHGGSNHVPTGPRAMGSESSNGGGYGQHTNNASAGLRSNSRPSSGVGYGQQPQSSSDNANSGFRTDMNNSRQSGRSSLYGPQSGGLPANFYTQFGSMGFVQQQHS